jgi:hypothetical protein
MILPKLQMRPAVKIGLYCTFALGLINLIFCLTRFLTIQIASEQVQFLSLSLIGMVLLPYANYRYDTRNDLVTDHPSTIQSSGLP